MPLAIFNDFTNFLDIFLFVPKFLNPPTPFKKGGL